MANIKAGPIVTRLREVITQGYGSARTIASGTYEDIPTGLEASEEQRRALVRPQVRVNIRQGSRAEASPPILGNFLIYNGAVDIDCIRPVTTGEQVDDATRETQEAACLLDMDVLRQALEYPGNLTLTAAGTATDIASGMLFHVSSDWRIDGRINDGAQSAISTHRFTGLFFARP